MEQTNTIQEGTRHYALFFQLPKPHATLHPVEVYGLSRFLKGHFKPSTKELVADNEVVLFKLNMWHLPIAIENDYYLGGQLYVEIAGTCCWKFYAIIFTVVVFFFWCPRLFFDFSLKLMPT